MTLREEMPPLLRLDAMLLAVGDCCVCVCVCVCVCERVRVRAHACMHMRVCLLSKKRYTGLCQPSADGRQT